MLPKPLILALALVASLLIVSCGDDRNSRDDRDASTAPTVSPDIRDRLQKPGMITHVRYTSFTPPWPTRTEAWIDWENDRVRTWNIQWTDSPTNPSVCTSIQHADGWYPCLPSLENYAAEDFSRLYAIWPRVPLRTSDSEVSFLGGVQAIFSGASDVDWATLKIAPEATTTATSQGDTNVVVNSWEVLSAFEVPCPEGQAGSATFDYTATEEGEPISEFMMVSCGAERGQYLGVLYHEIEFVEPSDLPPDFFDADATRASLIGDQLSSAAAQLGAMFWLGEQAGEWTLQGVEQREGTATVGYSRGDGDEEDAVTLQTRAPGSGRLCDNAEPIPHDAYNGSLCSGDYPGDDEYRIVWTPPGFDLWLEQESYPPDLTRDDVLALAASIQRWERSASEPLLTGDDVRRLVADSLELVCPSKLRAIREARSTAAFTFDRETGEWHGAFGSFGEYAVPDSKPVAIPASQREEVESTLSHNAAQFAECTFDEQPPPQEGDDVLGIEFMGPDEDGLSFKITGVDSDTEAALSFCLLSVGDDSGCELTDPDGTNVELRGVNINTIRSNVVEIDVGLSPDELGRTGPWTMSLDLGDGRKTSTTFDVR